MRTVWLNVYDIVTSCLTLQFSLNHVLHPIGIGAYHTGIQVESVGKEDHVILEYCYGGHEGEETGVFQISARRELPGTRYRESIKLGDIDDDICVEAVVLELSQDWPGQRYDVLRCNCNHFTQQLAQRLCGSTLPPWINRLAYSAGWLPSLLTQCLGEGVAPPTAPRPPSSASASSK